MSGGFGEKYLADAGNSSIRRHNEAQQTMQALFTRLNSRNASLESKRRAQGREFLKVQRARYELMLQWYRLRQDKAQLEEDKLRFIDALDSRWMQELNGQDLWEDGEDAVSHDSKEGHSSEEVDGGAGAGAGVGAGAGAGAGTTGAGAGAGAGAGTESTDAKHESDVSAVTTRPSGAKPHDGTQQPASGSNSPSETGERATSHRRHPGSRPRRTHNRVKLNIGGQIFEVTRNVLNRDGGSVLAAIASGRSGLPTDEEGAFFFDRDWWVFRYVLQFLREGPPSLPSSKPLLKQLYREAAFWRLVSLQDAVRDVFQEVVAVEDGPATHAGEAVAKHREWELRASRALELAATESARQQAARTQAARIRAHAQAHRLATDYRFGRLPDPALSAALTSGLGYEHTGIPVSSRLAPGSMPAGHAAAMWAASNGLGGSVGRSRDPAFPGNYQAFPGEPYPGAGPLNDPFRQNQGPIPVPQPSSLAGGHGFSRPGDAARATGAYLQAERARASASVPLEYSRSPADFAGGYDSLRRSLEGPLLSRSQSRPIGAMPSMRTPADSFYLSSTFGSAAVPSAYATSGHGAFGSAPLLGRSSFA